VKTYSLEQAVRAQKALRDAAALGPERFPVPSLRRYDQRRDRKTPFPGKSDQDIATLIAANSNIKITAAEIAEHYAPPEERQQHHD
jgi:hypothetical protein